MIYAVRCSNPECGSEFETWAKVKGRHRIRCNKCGAKVDIVITPVAVIPDIDEEFDVGIGEVVKSRQHKKKLLKEKGLYQI